MSARIRPTHLFFAAVAAGFVGAAGGLFARSVPQAEPLPGAEAQTVPPSPHVPAAPSGTAAAAAPAGTTLVGKVLEVLEVPSYTYVRVGAGAEEGQGGTWAAVPTAKLTVGAPIRVRAELEMRDFESTSLKRRFDSIWFGVIDDGAAPVSANAPPGTAPANAPSVPVGKVARADGDLGRTVAEVHAQRTALAGRKVRVRAVVVKLTEGVLGKNYLHVRDGSGDAQTATDDLSVTTLATTKVGDTIVLEGVVKLDVDVGSGYQFPTIVEDAVLVP